MASLESKNSPRPRRRGAGRWVPAAVVLGAIIALMSPAIAAAHAKYNSSNPGANAVLKAAPSAVTVSFLENVNPVGSDLTIYDATGKVVSTGPAQVSHSNTKMMVVGMKGDGSDNYMVVWRTVSLDDGAPDIGAFNFFIGSDAAPAPPAPTQVSSGMPAWSVALIGVVGLGLGGAGGTLLARRRKA
jgi:methionine-rich copper-binding protein CopC